MIDTVRRNLLELAAHVGAARQMAILGEALQWSNCVHGSAAPTIMLKSIEYFRDEIDEHIQNKRCPARVCRDLIRYEIASEGEQLAEAAAVCRPAESLPVLPLFLTPPETSRRLMIRLRRRRSTS